MSPFDRPAAPALLPAGRWRLEPGSSSVAFAVRHLGLAKVRGRFGECAAALDGHGVVGTVEVASLDTGERIRDRRLLAELFEAERFPLISFESGGPLRSPLSGLLTIRDVTRPVTFDVRVDERGTDGVRLRATGNISRRDFGLEWSALVEGGRVLVGDRVEITLELVLHPC